MYPVLFQVGTVSIYAFGLFLALGIVAGGVVAALASRRMHLSTHGLFDIILFIIFVGVIGARIAYVIAYPAYFRPPQGSLLQVLALWQGGLVFYGAIAGGLLAVWYVFRHNHHELWKWFDVTMLSFLSGSFFGHVGCMLGGCGGGVATTLPIAIEGKLPTHLIEGMWALILLALGSLMYLKNPAFKKAGLLFLIGALLYLAVRLLLDLYRPITLKWGSLPVAQVLDVILLALVAIALLLRIKKVRLISDIDQY